MNKYIIDSKECTTNGKTKIITSKYFTFCITTLTDINVIKITNLKRGYSLYYNYNTTGNCQLASIAYISNLLDNIRKDESDPNNNVNIIFDDLFSVLASLGFLKNLLLLDIRKEYEKKLDSYFDADNIVIKTHYISSNGSNMILYTIRVSDIPESNYNIENLTLIEKGNEGTRNAYVNEDEDDDGEWDGADDDY